jgi:hypothetical protein
MEGLITTICLTAYALGWANAEQVCLNADTIVEVSERYDIQSYLLFIMKADGTPALDPEQELAGLPRCFQNGHATQDGLVQS